MLMEHRYSDRGSHPDIYGDCSRYRHEMSCCAYHVAPPPCCFYGEGRGYHWAPPYSKVAIMKRVLECVWEITLPIFFKDKRASMKQFVFWFCSRGNRTKNCAKSSSKRTICSCKCRCSANRSRRNPTRFPIWKKCSRKRKLSCQTRRTSYSG